MKYIVAVKYNLLSSKGVLTGSGRGYVTLVGQPWRARVGSSKWKATQFRKIDDAYAAIDILCQPHLEMGFSLQTSEDFRDFIDKVEDANDLLYDMVGDCDGCDCGAPNSLPPCSHCECGCPCAVSEVLSEALKMAPTPKSCLSSGTSHQDDVEITSADIIKLTQESVYRRDFD